MLKEIIEHDAELIGQLLLERKRLTIHEIENITGYREMYLFLPLGWLLREHKIVIIEKDESTYIDLIQKHL